MKLVEITVLTRFTGLCVINRDGHSRAPGLFELGARRVWLVSYVAVRI